MTTIVKEGTKLLIEYEIMDDDMVVYNVSLFDSNGLVWREDYVNNVRLVNVNDIRMNEYDGIKANGKFKMIIERKELIVSVLIVGDNYDNSKEVSV